MAVTKIKRTWWVDLRWRGVRYRRRSPLNTRFGASEYEQQLRLELARHSNLDALDQRAAPPTMPTFAEFAVRWMDEYVRPKNKLSERINKQTVLRAHLVPAFGELRLDQINTVAVDRFVAAQLERGLAPKTINNHMVILRRCLATATEWDIPLKIPRIRPLRVPPQPFRFLRPDEINAIIAFATEPWRTMVAVAADTGVRFSELIALDWSDVDLAARRITIRRGCVKGVFDSPKNNRVRHLRLTAEAWAALDALPHREGLLFTNHGKVINDETARRHLAEACRRAGIEPIGWHALRHSFASELIRRGASVFSVKELLGHQDVEVTMRYAHLNQDSLDESVLLLDRPVGSAAGAQPIPPATLPSPLSKEDDVAKTTEKAVVDHGLFCGSESGDRNAIHVTRPEPIRV